MKNVSNGISFRLSVKGDGRYDVKTCSNALLELFILRSYFFKNLFFTVTCRFYCHLPLDCHWIKFPVFSRVIVVSKETSTTPYVVLFRYVEGNKLFFRK